MGNLFNIDKLHILLTCNYQIDTLLKLSVKNLVLTLSKHVDNNYIFVYDIQLLSNNKLVHVGYLKKSQRQNKNIDKIEILNKSLYIDKQLLISLFNTLKQLQIDNKLYYNISVLDIAIDTPTNLYNKCKELEISKDYKCHKGYVFSKFINDLQLSDELSTYYIQHLKDRTSNSYNDKKHHHSKLRIENKTNELKVSNKQYISDLHNNHFNSNNDIYRLEYQLKRDYLITSWNDVVYINDENDYISEYKYLQSLNYNNDYLNNWNQSIENYFINITDEKYVLNEKILKEYSVKTSIETVKEIDLSLIFNTEYQKAILKDFNNKKLLINKLDDILDLNINDNNKYIIENKKRIKIMKTEQNLEKLPIEKVNKLNFLRGYLSKEIDISELEMYDNYIQQAVKQMNKDNTYNIDSQLHGLFI